MRRLIYASSISAIATTIFTVVITIIAEISEPLKNNLKNISGHHWITKSVLTVIVYIVVLALVYAASKTPSKDKTRSSLYVLILVSIIGSFSILAFFILEQM